MNISSKIKTLLLSLFLFFLSTATVFATSGWSLQVDWPTSPGPDGGRNLTTQSGVADLVAYFYEWAIGIGIIIFFGSLIFSGFQLLTSVGRSEKMKAARKRLIASFSGIFLLLGSYIILNTINPELTQISQIQVNREDLGTHEFQGGMTLQQDMCEFAFLTVEEEDESSQETHFMIPGMEIKTNEIFPISSIACKPEKDDSEILEVRINDIEDHFQLVKRRSGERVDGVDVVSYDDSGYDRDDLKDLHAKRYTDRKEVTVDADQEIITPLLDAADKGTYNANYTSSPGDICEEMIKNSDFERERCLEIEESGGDIKIYEWTRIGYGSLTDALNYLEDTNQLNPLKIGCPTAEEMGTDLGYERDRTGGGCRIAFYDGTTRDFPVFGRERPTCRQRISQPLADSDDLKGAVDRESNCMALRRHERLLEEFREEIYLSVSFEAEDSSTGLEPAGVSITLDGPQQRRLSPGDSQLVVPGKYTLQFEDIKMMGSGTVLDSWESPSQCRGEGDECEVEIEDDLRIEVKTTVE